jgi:hypothetical protein
MFGLLYDITHGQGPVTGIGTFFTVNPTNYKYDQLQQDTNWNKYWTRIISGAFIGANLPDATLFFYDQGAGGAAYYRLDRQGNLTSNAQIGSGYRTSWSQIVAGPFGAAGGRDRLLFYDNSGSVRQVGVVEVYDVLDTGSIQLVNQQSDLPITWDQIVPFRLGTQSYLFTYDSINGMYQTYEVVGSKAILQPVGNAEACPHTWTRIITLEGSSISTLPPKATLLIYEKSTGEVTISSLTSSGQLTPVTRSSLGFGWTGFVGSQDGLIICYKPFPSQLGYWSYHGGQLPSHLSLYYEVLPSRHYSQLIDCSLSSFNGLRAEEGN